MRGSRARAAVFACTGLLAVSCLAGCGDDREAHPAHPVVLVGFDGMEWSVAAPLLREGRMPHLRALIERGSCGYLWTERPALSPVCWTSIATGKRRDEHGIREFLDAGKVPYTSNARAVKALWNIASDYGLRTLCVGWWVTWPAEEIRGFMVAPYSAAGQNAFNWKGNMKRGLADQTWPRDLLDELWPIAEQASTDAERAALAASIFDPSQKDAASAEEREFEGQSLWSVFADEAYSRILTHLQRRPGFAPDLTLAYYGATDVVSHRFWRYMEPGAFRYRIPADAVGRFKETIATSYALADDLLGRALEHAPPDANVIVCSDHGFHADFLDEPPPSGLSGHHLDGPAGIVVAAGPDFVDGFGRAAVLDGNGAIPDAGLIYDVAPTILRLLDIPTGRDMQQPDGGPLWRRVVRKDADARSTRTPIRTHDEGFRAPSDPRDVDPGMIDDTLDWLDQNGYLNAGGANGDERTSPRTDGPRRAAAVWDGLNAVRDGLRRWRDAHGAPPEALEVLTRQDGAGAAALSAEALRDPWGRLFVYERRADGGWRLGSLGADGAPGGYGADADAFVAD